MSIELGNRSSQGIQVGRTVVTFDIRKDPPGPKEDYRNIESRDCSRKLIADRNYKNQ